MKIVIIKLGKVTNIELLFQLMVTRGLTTLKKKNKKTKQVSDQPRSEFKHYQIIHALLQRLGLVHNKNRLKILKEIYNN